jgi:hypothetical protein
MYSSVGHCELLLSTLSIQTAAAWLRVVHPTIHMLEVYMEIGGLLTFPRTPYSRFSSSRTHVSTQVRQSGPRSREVKWTNADCIHCGGPSASSSTTKLATFSLFVVSLEPISFIFSARLDGTNVRPERRETPSARVDSVDFTLGMLGTTDDGDS